MIVGLAVAEILEIAAKSVPFVYRGFKAQLTYIRKTKKWKWEFTHIMHHHFSGEADDIDDARKEVKKHVDTIIGPSTS